MAACAALLCFAGAPFAQPRIDAIETAGPAVDGTRLVVRGGGFGERPDAPVVSDRFEDGAQDARLGEPWTTWQSGKEATPHYEGGGRRRGSTLGVLCQMYGADEESSFGLRGDFDSLYVSFWRSIRYTGSFTRSWTQLRLRGSSAGGYPEWAHILRDADDGQGQWVAGSADDAACTLPGSAYGGLGDDVVDVRRWVRQDYWLRQGAPNVADGEMIVWRDLQPEPIAAGPAFASRCGDARWTELRIGQAWAHDPGGDASVLFDDVYVDVTRARVEVANTPVFSYASVSEIQPSVSWADDAIEVDLQLGSYAVGSTYFLFVIDEAGVASDGITLQLGSIYGPAGDAGPEADAGSTLTRVEGGCSCRTTGGSSPRGAALPCLLLAFAALSGTMRKHLASSWLLAAVVGAASCHAECRAGGEGGGEGEGGEAPAATTADPGTTGGRQAAPGWQPPAEPATAAPTTPSTSAPPVTAASARTPRDPVRCAGRDEVTLENVAIQAGEGSAVRASGRCKVKLVSSSIEGGTAIEATGQSTVEVENSTVSGTSEAIRASGQAQVTLRGCTVTGKSEVRGNARVNDAGGNTMPTP